MKAKYFEGNQDDTCILDKITMSNGDLPYNTYVKDKTIKGVSDTTEEHSSYDSNVVINTRGVGLLAITVIGNNLAYSDLYLIYNTTNQGVSAKTVQLGSPTNFGNLGAGFTISTTLNSHDTTISFSSIPSNKLVTVNANFYKFVGSSNDF